MAASIGESVLDHFAMLGWPIALGATSAGFAPAFLSSGELAGEAVTEHTRMYVASVTKQLIGALAAMAVVSGQLDPEASVRDVVGELPTWAGPIQIRHLVQHTSGLPTTGRVVEALACYRESDLTNPAVLDGLAALDAPDRPPGVAFEYSNVGYVCLAEAVSRATGASLPELARSVVFTPLGMTGSRLGGDPPVLLPGVPAPPRTIGDGGWWTTASDLLAWQLALNERALGDEVTRIIESPGALADGTPVAYGWGVAISWRNGVRTFGHGGAWPDWTAKTVRQPDHGTAVALLSSRRDIERISEAGLHLADELTAAARSV